MPPFRRSPAASLSRGWQRVPRFVELKNGVILNTERLRERPELWQEVLQVALDTEPKDVYISLKQFLKK
jgi:hypothetical protein